MPERSRSSQDTEPGGAIVTLVGITANRRKRRSLQQFLAERASLPVYVPWIPYALGFDICGRLLEWYLRSRVLARGHRTVHLLAYIGGGFLLRYAAQHWSFVRFGRIVYNRSPIQEAVPVEIVRRVPRLVLLLTGHKSVIDLASAKGRDLPFPDAELEQGVIVETEPSRMARRFGLGEKSMPVSEWHPENLLPGADEVKALQISHDDVYDSAVFLSEALAFLETGHFRPEGQKRQQM